MNSKLKFGFTVNGNKQWKDLARSLIKFESTKKVFKVYVFQKCLNTGKIYEGFIASEGLIAEDSDMDGELMFKSDIVGRIESLQNENHKIISASILET